MKHTFETTVLLYHEFYGEKLSSSCYQLFSTLCIEAWGHYKENIRPLSLADLKTMVRFSVPTITAAIKDLESEGLIKITRGHGKGKKNVYEINFKKIKSLCKKSLYKESLSKEFLLDTVSENIIISNRSVEESHEETPTALPSASPPAVKPARSSTHIPKKKSSEEKQAFAAVYEVFETKRGPFEPGLVNKEMPAIWKLVSKAQTVSPDNWEDLLVRMLAEFWRIKTSGREQDAFLAKQPFLPSALNSSGIWPRVLENLRSTESKKPTAEDVRLMDIAAAALRG
jgi:DNA-binding transcriptional regulator YhcF (GntR family)